MIGATPTPARLFVHDDFTFEVTERHGAASTAARLARELLALVAVDTARVVILTEAAQLRAVVARGDHAPFDVTIGVGRAGARVAERVHALTGWFPAIERVDVTREEDGQGAYHLDTFDRGPLPEQIAHLRLRGRVAVVDDTIFSGMTMHAVLAALPPEPRRRAHVFCLRCVAASLGAIEAICPVTSGIAAPGRLLEDVSFINASGLVLRGAIRRAGRPPLAFFERPEWIAAWFPGHDEVIIAACRQLNALLEPRGTVDGPVSVEAAQPLA